MGQIDFSNADDIYAHDKAKQMYINFAYLPHAVASSTICSSISVGVFLFIEKESECPKTFIKPFGILNIGLVVSTIFHIVIGAVGYSIHGINAKYPHFKFKNNVAKSALIMGHAFGMVITFAIHGYCVVNIISFSCFRKFLRTKDQLNTFEMGLRFFTCVIVCKYTFFFFFF